MATKEQMTTIETRAYNDVAREMAAEGVDLTHAQADRIGDEGTAWLEQRLGLRCTATEDGLECEVAS